MATQFTYCLNTSTIRPAALVDKIRIAGAAGYRAIELWHDDVDAYVEDGGSLSDLKKLLVDCGLQLPTTIHMKDWFDTAGEAHRQAIDKCKRKMAQAAELGAQYVIAGPPRGPADRDQGARHYRELLEIGRQIGTLPAMEFLGFVDDINTIEAGWEIVTMADHPDGTIVMDPFHIFRGGGSPDAIRSLPGDRIAICHFNDAPSHPPPEQQHDKDRVYPGDGHIDLRHIVRCLKEIGFRGCISLELFNERYWAQDPFDVARTGLEKMREIVEGSTHSLAQ